MHPQIEELAEFERAVRSAKPEEPESFRALFATGVDLLGLQLKEVAEKFSMSPASVTRWRQGKNAPHPAFRRVVYAWLAKRALQLRKRLENAQAPVHATEQLTAGVSMSAAAGQGRKALRRGPID